MKTMKISLETAKSIYGKDESIDRILRETFTNEELGIKPKLPKKWEDLEKLSGFHINANSDIYNSVDINRSDRDKNILPTKELAEAMLAMCQLLYLRDIYNDGWQPDWEDDNNKYVIIYSADILSTTARRSTSTPMAFKTPEIRDEFLANFKELLKTAKPLL